MVWSGWSHLSYNLWSILVLRALALKRAFTFKQNLLCSESLLCRRVLSCKDAGGLFPDSPSNTHCLHALEKEGSLFPHILGDISWFFPFFFFFFSLFCFLSTEGRYLGKPFGGHLWMLDYLRNRSWDLRSTDGICQYSSSPCHSCFIVFSSVFLENYNSIIPQCRTVFYGCFAFHFNLNLMLLCPVIFISLITDALLR